MSDKYSEEEGGGLAHGGSAGTPAAEALEDAHSLIGHPQSRHWRDSTITDDDLTDRGGVFFAAVEMTRMPMILTDPRLPDNPIVFANKAFLDLTGYEESEVMHRNCRFLQGPQTDRESVRLLREAIAAREAISLEILNYKRDGTRFWNAIFLGPVFGKDGKLLYFFASQLDVTRRRDAQDSYRQAQKMEAVGQLTAGLAHDFNNLLQVIAGCHEMLERQVEAPDLRRRLDMARAATDRAARLTSQLLAFARKTRLEPRPVDLSSTVMTFADLLDSTIGSRIDLQLNLRHRLPPCLIDPVHFETALLNIVVNARDAMPNGGTITIATSRVRQEHDPQPGSLPEGDYVLVTVTDTGEGMPPAVAARAVEPFFTTKSLSKGTGLGLAMVHGFVEQSRGRLEIDTEPQRGTTIRLFFPVHVGEQEQAIVEEPAPKRDVETSRLPEGNGQTVLVVEDSEHVLTLARDHLTDLGYRVLTAPDADAALVLLDQQTAGIDLLFTDIMMPGSMNGIGLAAEMRRRAPGVPVLFTTGYNEGLSSSDSASDLDVLSKPYRRSELAERVSAAIARKDVGQPRRRPSDFGAAEH